MKHLILIFITLLYSVTGYSQGITISGYIRDKESKESLIGATVFLKGTDRGTVTNGYGFYSISGSGISAELVVSHLGYRSFELSTPLRSDTIIDLYLVKESTEIEEATVSYTKKRENQLQVLKLTYKELDNIPSLTGDKDVLKAFQMLPGVQFGNEGNSSLIVRGGGPDQNLFLLDDMPLFYVNHLGGIFSILNENSINSVELFKSAIPAHYGGRLSSVVDIRLKEGDADSYHGKISAGMLNSQISFEGPIIKEKSSFFLSLRRSNVDLFTRTFCHFMYKKEKQFAYTLYDVNAKFNYRISDRDRLYLSLYNGRDRLFLANDYKVHNAMLEPENRYSIKSLWENNWGNTVLSLRWNRILSKKIFSNFTVGYSGFNYTDLLDFDKTLIETGIKATKTYNKFSSSINDIITKIDINYYPNSYHTIQLGAKFVVNKFNPSNSTIKKITNDYMITDTTINSSIHAAEFSFYLEDKLKISEYFSGTIGVRTTGYSTANDFFYSLEPRISLVSEINNNIVLNASYAKLTQPLHLLSNSGTGLPTDLWIPATKRAKPEVCDHFSVGGEIYFLERKYVVSAEGFLKKSKNLVDFSDGITFFANTEAWEEQVEGGGIGNVKGVEFLLKKAEGKATGWIGYTLMKSERKFESINNGEFYPYIFDRRHDLSLHFAYIFSDKINVSLNWIFLSGCPTTLGVAKMNAMDFQYEKTESDNNFTYITKEVYVYGSKNNYRLPAYHRLDVGINLKKIKKLGTRVISFNIYNLYNQKNPYFIYYEKDEKTNESKLYKLCIFPIVPSVNYSFTF